MSVIDVAVAIAIGCVLILLGIALFHIVQAARASAVTNNQPGISDVLDALTPYIYRAILAGERATLWGLDQVDASIHGADKKAVADSVYALLPDMVMVGSFPLPLSTIKAFVPRETFEARVKDLYDQADAFIQRNEVYLKSQVDSLIPAQTPPAQQTAS